MEEIFFDLLPGMPPAIAALWVVYLISKQVGSTVATVANCIHNSSTRGALYLPVRIQVDHRYPNDERADKPEPREASDGN